MKTHALYDLVERIDAARDARFLGERFYCEVLQLLRDVLPPNSLGAYVGGTYSPILRDYLFATSLPKGVAPLIHLTKSSVDPQGYAIYRAKHPASSFGLRFCLTTLRRVFRGHVPNNLYLWRN